jgi:3-hydroxyacyl-CoA dehydrogenase/enoyl-CoA hydratase/3-hydroxybutyryl-CoA epimerase
MILGTGWAPFRGGPLRYADAIWAAEVTRRLDLLAHDVAPHFKPCQQLRAMAEIQGRFYIDRPVDPSISRPYSVTQHPHRGLPPPRAAMAH